MKYLLDTCVLSETSKPRPNSGVLEWLSAVDAADLFVPSIVVGELAFGIEKLDAGFRKDNLAAWLSEYKTRFKSMIVPFDDDAAELWGIRKALCEKSGKPRPVIDSQIAAIAAVRDMTIVTRNVRDFEGLSVRVFNPFRPFDI